MTARPSWTLGGDKVSVDLEDAITTSSYEMSLEDAQIVLGIVSTDAVKKVARITKALTIGFGDDAYALETIQKSGPERYELRFIPAIVDALKERDKKRTAKAETKTRDQFIRMLSKSIPGVELKGERLRQKTNVELSTEGDDWWEAAQGVAADINARLWCRQGQLWMATDKWLMERDPVATLTEDMEEVNWITWERPKRGRVARMDLEVSSEYGGLLPGDVVKVLGQATYEKWLLARVTGSFHDPRTVLEMVRPEPRLPEPEAGDAGQVGSSGSSGRLTLGSPDLSGISGRASGRVQTFLGHMRGELGGRYVWGGTSHRAADCSGIVYHILNHHMGVSFPRHTSHTIPGAGRVISVGQAIRTPGAILQRAGHMAISLGNGKTWEAMGSAYGIRQGSAHGRFHRGVLLRQLFG